MNSLKIRLSAVRVNAGLSQQDIADKMGVSRITVGNWESGKVKMKEAELRMYADICSFPRENIFCPTSSKMNTKNGKERHDKQHKFKAGRHSRENERYRRIL